MKTNQILVVLCVATLAPQIMHAAPKKKATSGNNQQQPDVDLAAAPTTQIGVPVAPIIPPTNPFVLPTTEAKKEEHFSQRRFVETTEADSPRSKNSTPTQAKSPRSPGPAVRATLETHLTTTEIQQLSKLLPQEATEWDDADENGPTSTRPRPTAPSYWAKMAAVPAAWWEAHVSDQYRIERLRVFCGLTSTYALLLEKIQSQEYRGFIDDLNKEHGEGTRWLDAALQETTDAQLEGPTRRLLTQSTDFIPGLPTKTRNKLSEFFSRLSDKKRTGLEKELTEYTLDQQDLADLWHRVHATSGQTKPDNHHEEFARSTALAATQFGSHGLFPKAIEQKK